MVKKNQAKLGLVKSNARRPYFDLLTFDLLVRSFALVFVDTFTLAFAGARKKLLSASFISC